MEDEEELYKYVSGDSYQVARMADRTGRNTRQNVVYQITDEVKSNPPPPKYASVIPSETNTVRLHSTAKIPAPAQRPLLLREVLNSWPNRALWRHFTCTRDGSWIREGLTRGILLLVHDGSYMKNVDPNVCSAAYVLYGAGQQVTKHGAR